MDGCTEIVKCVFESLSAETRNKRSLFAKRVIIYLLRFFITC